MKIEIVSIEPEDRFNLEGKEGNLLNDQFIEGQRMVITFGASEGFKHLATSSIEGWSKEKDKLQVRTKNSIYTLKIEGE